MDGDGTIFELLDVLAKDVGVISLFPELGSHSDLLPPIVSALSSPVEDRSSRDCHTIDLS